MRGGRSFGGLEMWFRRDRRVPKSVFNRFLAEHIGEDLYTLVNMKEEAQARCGDGS